MLTLVNIYRVPIKKKDGTYSDWFDLLCSDSYSAKSRLCGSPSKTLRVSPYVLNKALGGDDSSNMIQPAICEKMVGMSVYSMYNERGYISYIKFFDPDDKSDPSAHAPAAGGGSPDPAPTDDGFPM